MKSWWRPPELRIQESNLEPRHATWLELFFDLSFVVAIGQLAENLSQNISLVGFLTFVGLFIPIWWSWLNSTYYSNLFDTDDLLHRLLTAANMVAVVALAVNLHDGFNETSVGFALSYTAIRILLIVEFLRAGWHIVAARPLTTRAAKSFGVAALLWLISAFMPIPVRFGFWILGLTVDLSMALTAGSAVHVKLAPHDSHLPERFGLFTLIVLGESFWAVIRGVEQQPWSISSGIAIVFSISIIFSLWWIYFENLGGSAIQAARTCRSIAAYQTWLYVHLPLVIGLTATGVGLEHLLSITPDLVVPLAERCLICTGVVLCFLSLGIIYIAGLSNKARLHCKIRAMYRFGSAALVLVFAIAGADLLPVELIGLIAAVCATQIILDLRQVRVAS
ncbi:low temperature requirement protein A [Merismopedia glauca]|uniref:Low temperature requirement protein A n=1 Tax=Merismopedia glauca CCAP 1448/3 TaxID=1296344 RepID=A0A2T1C4F6_9CYAN|nr:low temperature requirement protein A [Merismopedia glauca]PSB03131.1 low temperature requirement protein A [Merismopedia glauca CCAP 1448/3]